MQRKQGFTLVELLVVMAIIAILAAIAIPNIQRWILKARATQAMTEINNIELAITKMLSDAGSSSIKDLFNPAYFEDEFGTHYTWDADTFDDVAEIYTFTITALLRKGRGALDTVQRTSAANSIRMLREDVVRNLGTEYFAELALDPWGNLYNIYPGTWPSNYGLIVFRTYLPPSPDATPLPGDELEDVEDELTLVSDVSLQLIDPDTGDDLDAIGAPANRRSSVFIWSHGANLESGQARYIAPDPSNPTAIPYVQNDLSNYRNTVQEPELLGGGDDINNWDKGQTFMRFYN